MATAVLLATGAACFRNGDRVAAQEGRDNAGNYLAQIDAYKKQGRYDEAVQAGLKAVRNTAHDAVVYEQIAMVYLVRAGKDSDKERWTEEAAKYINKAVSAESDNPVNVLDAARSFEMAGDLSIARRCAYYVRAIELSRTVVHVLESEHVSIGGERYSIDPVRKDLVAYGHTFHVQPLKDENDKMAVRLQTKSADARCKKE